MATAADAIAMGSSPLELRSSVLDAALTLGLRNSVMRNWLDDTDAAAAESSDVNEVSPVRRRHFHFIFISLLLSYFIPSYLTT